MNSSQYRWVRLLIIALWLTVSALIGLIASVITANTEWGPGLPPVDYIEFGKLSANILLLFRVNNIRSWCAAVRYRRSGNLAAEAQR
jgi:hypothetical protein